MQAFDFTGKTVFVAGGTSGINLGIAEAFAEAGAKLVIVSRSQNHVDEAQRRLRVFDGEVVALQQTCGTLRRYQRHLTLRMIRWRHRYPRLRGSR